MYREEGVLVGENRPNMHDDNTTGKASSTCIRLMGLVKSGFAWHYKQYASGQSVRDRSLYAIAEEKAHSSHL
jgi:hypothetical protein